jgi:hypothetical protein
MIAPLTGYPICNARIRMDHEYRTAKPFRNSAGHGVRKRGSAAHRLWRARIGSAGRNVELADFASALRRNTVMDAGTAVALAPNVRAGPSGFGNCASAKFGCAQCNVSHTQYGDRQNPSAGMGRVLAPGTAPAPAAPDLTPQQSAQFTPSTAHIRMCSLNVLAFWK